MFCLLVFTKDFKDAVDRVSTISIEKTRAVKLEINNNTLILKVNNSEIGNAIEELTIKFGGEKLEIGFNSRFLIEMTNNLDCKEVKLEMSLPNRAGILRPLDGYSDDEELTMLVMPVMLNN